MAPSVPKASRTRRNIGRGYGPKVNHHGEPGISRKFNDLRHLWPAPRRPYGILARHKDAEGHARVTASESMDCPGERGLLETATPESCRRVRAERKSKGETLASARQDEPQFPLHPYSCDVFRIWLASCFSYSGGSRHANEATDIPLHRRRHGGALLRPRLGCPTDVDGEDQRQQLRRLAPGRHRARREEDDRRRVRKGLREGGREVRLRARG